MCSICINLDVNILIYRWDISSFHLSKCKHVVYYLIFYLSSHYIKNRVGVVHFIQGTSDPNVLQENQSLDYSKCFIEQVTICHKKRINYKLYSFFMEGYLWTLDSVNQIHISYFKLHICIFIKCVVNFFILCLNTYSFNIHIRGYRI